MKKVVKSVLSVALFLCCILNLNAQINFEGSNDYGRTYDITYDLNVEGTIYAVTLGNHLMESQNEGEDWEVIYTFPSNGPSLRELRLIGDATLSFYVQNSFNPSNNTIYLFDIDTREIIKQYTPPVSTGATQEWVNAYSIYENDTDVVLFNQDYKIGTAVYSKVYYTSNGGNSWVEVYDHLDYDSIFPNNVAISPTDPLKLFIARGVGPNSTEGGLFVSEDAGTTWVEKEAGQVFRSIAFNPENPDHMFMGTGSGYTTTVENLYQSLDGGDTWQIVPITWDDYFLDSINYIAFNPNDVDNVIVLEGNEIAITTDGGSTWYNYIYGEDPGSYYYGLHASFNPFQAGELYIDTDFYPVKSTDGGVTVSQFGNPFFHSTKVGVSVVGDQHLYYGVQRGLVHKNQTTLEESAFYVEPINYVFAYKAPVFTIDRNIEGRIYVFTDSFINGQDLRVSNIHGQSAQSIFHTEFNTFFHIVTDPNNNNKVWTSFEYSGTLKIDFTDINNPVSEQVSMPTNNYHLSSFIDPSDSNNVLVGLGGEVYQTLDGGTSWTNVSTGLSLNTQSGRIYEIKQNPYNSSEYLLATNQGIYQTVDGAQNWTQVYFGSNVRKVEYSTVSEGQIAAAVTSSETSQAQVIFSVENGVEWTEVPFESIEHSGSSSMDFIFQENSITAYISSYDLGVISYEIDTTILANPNHEGNENMLIVFPNPVVSNLNVVLKNGTTANNITVYTYTGKKVLEVSQQNNINISNLSRGVYFVRVINNEGALFIKKIIKE